MINFAELSKGGGEDVNFLVRWRGRQEGPYSASVVEAKLTAHEIGLLHEILYRDQWVTIRDYMAEREAMLRAEQEAREAEERQAREEAERQAKEREEQLRVATLAEEKRRAALLESSQPQPRQNSDEQIRRPIPDNNHGAPGLRVLGAILLIAGIVITGYFFLAFDTSVESGVGRVNNLGLMADRQNGIIVGIGLGIAGTIVLAIGMRGKN